jgi:hypothetical protein
MHLREIWTQVDADKEQGFDEFMNLVIDDAVEVTLANAKKETSEERRSIGVLDGQRHTHIANDTKAKSCSRATTFPSSSSSNKRASKTNR